MGYMGVMQIVERPTAVTLIICAVGFIVLNVFELKRKIRQRKIEYEAEDIEDEKKVMSAAASIIRVCERKGVEDFVSTIQTAIRDGSLSKVKQFIKKDPELFMRRDDNGCTILHYALESGNEDIVDYIVQLGAEVNAPDKQNRTPLHYAVEYCTWRSVNLLISKGAKVNERDNNGTVPLSAAMKLGKKEVETLLLKKGAFLRPQTNGR